MSRQSFVHIFLQGQKLGMKLTTANFQGQIHPIEDKFGQFFRNSFGLSSREKIDGLSSEFSKTALYYIKLKEITFDGI